MGKKQSSTRDPLSDWPSDQDRLVSLQKDLAWNKEQKQKYDWSYENIVHNRQMIQEKIKRLHEEIAELEEKIETGDMFG